MKSMVVVLYLFLVWNIVEGDRHFNQNGPFRKRHRLGDEPSPYACNRPSGCSLSTNASVGNINVSSTSYLSSEQIHISWTSISAPCVDDFVGIYFSDVDPSRVNLKN